MAESKISICNQALALIGAESIRDFLEDNIRARLCDIFYESVKEELLMKQDWTFARELSKLVEIVIPENEQIALIENNCVYQIPTTCIVPRDILPLGSETPWIIVGDRIYTASNPATLYYTGRAVDPTRFSGVFTALLAHTIAIKLGSSIPIDKSTLSSLLRLRPTLEADAWEANANSDNLYREFDETPANDSFVNP